MNDESPFLDMKMSWSLEAELKFSVFMEKGQQLKYVGKGITYITGTICAILSGFLNRLEKLTSRNPSLCSEGVDTVYPDHMNALCKAGLLPHIFSTMGDSCKMQDEKMDIENEKEPKANENKNRNVYFCVSYSRFLNVYPQGDQKAEKIF